jgi:ubiquinone biosynthesis monooxygenase Coq7
LDGRELPVLAPPGRRRLGGCYGFPARHLYGDLSKAGDVNADTNLIADILRVDHAGEFGAIQIYRAQRRVARWRAPELLEFLERTLEDERGHRLEFERLMQERGVQQCRALPLWAIGGSLLGASTAIMGRSAILICTEAVERTVHRHLQDQVAWVSARDGEIATALVRIQAEEMAHLEHVDVGEPNRRSSTLFLLDRLVSTATEALIWTSTYGASSRIAARLRR